MPITKEKEKLYPGGSLRSPEWLEIREARLEKAGHKCERCNAPHGVIVCRNRFYRCWAIPDPHTGELKVFDEVTGEEKILGGVSPIPDLTFAQFMCHYSSRDVQIILTIAHLDQDPTNNPKDGSNHEALCQMCHNRLDMPHRIKNARDTRRSKKACGDLFEGMM